ncbi:MAG: hypothetical protein A2W97_01965 [Bacteroidetes bacterium GWE2_40_63]|jgi:hypothetical protein|nr:MAG: hypothetical protein A2W84_16665 [Bacteroidetes bacterium GWC2_40_13]OFX72230.1 MAG: hypothetical protein A2W96_17435 [Bacteroidetes bacterium GWD2_40_43]OFX90524.1 MAG: hypothetical protein A2W97_01965 [Bacteroidetes bacterium GWE2_40_63]OFY17232.1 MAG: hypothetical protein A2W88_14900 [Bacteroidetes bacterium GWF2_40_13]HAZ03757.1 hypothetical protein [Marinilabiliales bacterium]
MGKRPSVFKIIPCLFLPYKEKITFVPAHLLNFNEPEMNHCRCKLLGGVIGCLLFCNLYSQGQEVLYFDIETKLMHLGELKITRTVEATTKLIDYKLQTRFGLWSFYTIDYLLESKFNGPQMVFSQSFIKVNGEYRHSCRVNQTTNGYERETLEGKNLVPYPPVQNAITRLYFEDFKGKDSVFSEFSGSFKPFILKENGSYVLVDKDPMEFYFANGRISKVVVPNPILDFYIVLRPQKQQ